MHVVRADGVGVKFPIFAVNCSRFPWSSERIREKRRKTKTSEEKRRKAKKNEKKRRKTKKIWENFCDPFYIKNLPITNEELEIATADSRR